MKRLFLTALPILALAALITMSALSGTAPTASAQGNEPGGPSTNPCAPFEPDPQPTADGTAGVTAELAFDSTTVLSAQTQECPREIQLCHQFANGQWALIWVPAAQVPVALLNGDVYPPCPTPTPPPTQTAPPTVTVTKTATPTPTPTVVVTTATPTRTATPAATTTVTVTVTVTATATRTVIASVTPIPPKTGSGGFLGDEDDGMRNGIILSIGLAIALGSYAAYDRRRRHQS